MMNWIWLGMIGVAFVVAAATGRMDALSKAAIDSAAQAVTLAIGLVGVMALWLGVMRVAQDGGLLKTIARVIRPVTVRLFPQVPPDHPAMSAMLMNIAANFLGLGNAATPFGIKAMTLLDELNPTKGTATDAMALFLCINTSNVSLIPITVIALRSSAGSANPAAIIGTTIFATLCATVVAVTAAILLSRLQRFRLAPPPEGP